MHEKIIETRKVGSKIVTISKIREYGSICYLVETVTIGNTDTTRGKIQ